MDLKARIKNTADVINRDIAALACAFLLAWNINESCFGGPRKDCWPIKKCLLNPSLKKVFPFNFLWAIIISNLFNNICPYCR